MPTFPEFPPTARRRVVVTGIGMITPLGLTASATWSGLCRGLTGTTTLNRVPQFLPGCIASHRQYSSADKVARLEALLDAMPCKVAAPVGVFEGEASEPADQEARQKTLNATAHQSRALLLGARAVSEALVDAQLIADAHATTIAIQQRDRIGVHIGMGIPSLADVTDVAAYLLCGDKVNYSAVNPFFVPKILGNMAAGETAIKYKVEGPVGSGVAACATGAHCIGEAAEWVRHGRADVMICGATEACITPVAVAGFSRMRALCTKYNGDPGRASRPFDANRGGFIMGEGAGVLIVEDYSHAVARGARIYAELRGFGVSCDAHHVAAPHPEGHGAAACIRLCLADGGNIPADCVSYVNAHATGTIGDSIELDAIEASILQTSNHRDSGAEAIQSKRRGPLRISSTKGALGHLLGAAGSVEACIALLALHHQRAPPTANLETPCVNSEEQLSRGFHLLQPEDAKTTDGLSALPDCSAVLSTSFGFGGINTALLFTTC